MFLSEARAATEKESIDNGDEEITVIEKNARLILVVRKTPPSHTGFSKYNLYAYTRPNLADNSWVGAAKRKLTDAEDALRWLGSEDGVIEELDIIGVLFDICGDTRYQADGTIERVREITLMGERVRKVTGLRRVGGHIYFSNYTGTSYDIHLDTTCICVDAKAGADEYNTRIDLTEPNSIERFESIMERAMVNP